MSITLKFHDVIPFSTRSMEMYARSYDGELSLEIICIKIFHGKNGDYEFVNLDKSTAIKFSKELRKQIALLD
jgi:hypothetical protein